MKNRPHAFLDIDIIGKNVVESFSQRVVLQERIWQENNIYDTITYILVWTGEFSHIGFQCFDVGYGFQAKFVC
jgi:hypothetical protein